jgi:hypothetical protein
LDRLGDVNLEVGSQRPLAGLDAVNFWPEYPLGASILADRGESAFTAPLADEFRIAGEASARTVRIQG